MGRLLEFMYLERQRLLKGGVYWRNRLSPSVRLMGRLLANRVYLGVY